MLLIGDVALAHDIGGLLANRRTDLAITIVLLNNDGGGIFHFLPVASQGEPFEQHIATPTGLEFERAAALYDCGYQLAADVETLEAADRRFADRRPDDDHRGAHRTCRQSATARRARGGGAGGAPERATRSYPLETA